MCQLIMIDDNPMEHLIMQKMFDSYGIFPNVEHSMDAKSTIDFLTENLSVIDQLPDVILLDLNMPNFNGWDFLEHFKKLYQAFKKHITIYIVSSSVAQEDRLRSETYPFVRSFLSKPLKRETLEQLSLLHD